MNSLAEDSGSTASTPSSQQILSTKQSSSNAAESILLDLNLLECATILASPVQTALQRAIQSVLPFLPILRIFLRVTLAAHHTHQSWRWQSHPCHTKLSCPHLACYYCQVPSTSGAGSSVSLFGHCCGVARQRAASFSAKYGDCQGLLGVQSFSEAWSAGGGHSVLSFNGTHKLLSTAALGKLHLKFQLCFTRCNRMSEAILSRLHVRIPARINILTLKKRQYP